MSRYKIGIDVEPKQKRLKFWNVVIMTALGAFLAFSGVVVMPLSFMKGILGLGLVSMGLSLIIGAIKGGEKR